MEPNRTDRWVADRLSALEPGWRPDFARGRKLLDAGLTRPPHPWRRSVGVVVPAAVVLGLIAVSIPQTRAFAQQLWYHLSLKRVDVVRVDFSEIPLHARVTVAGPPQAARDLEGSAQRAGFQPYLPSPAVLPANPSISTFGPVSVELTIHIGDLQAALDRVGARDVHVPSDWEGIQLRAVLGTIVNLGYPDDVGILQARSPELYVPAGFPLQRFAEVVFRSTGVSAPEARVLAQRFIGNPAWLFGIPADEIANVQEVSLPTGSALLVEEFGDDGKLERVTVFRSTNDRVYCVLANDRHLALRIAGALP
jgi:hypothetical protein